MRNHGEKQQLENKDTVHDNPMELKMSLVKHGLPINSSSTQGVGMPQGHHKWFPMPLPGMISCAALLICNSRWWNPSRAINFSNIARVPEKCEAVARAMRLPPLRAREVSRPTEQQDPHFLHKPDTFPLDTHRLSRRTGLDLVCHLAMTCTNTEKQLFTVDYTLSVPNNALDRRGHRRGAGL